MKKICLPIFLSISFSHLFSQSPEVALQMSWNTQAGTARNQAIGGAMGSLGGDASSLLVNPAGLAFYKTSDFIISPGLHFANGKSFFRDSKNSAQKINGNILGTSGFIIGGKGRRAKNSSGVIISRVANFNQNIYYKGLNDYSSFAELLADEFAASNLTIGQAMNNNSISLQTKMALYTYLVDTATITGVKRVIARSELVPNRQQINRIETSGGITEITWGESSELNEKWMVGISFGIPIIQYNRTQYYREEDASGNVNNNFNFFSYSENIKVSGLGMNFKTGVIFRPQDGLRLGIAFHSPSFLTLSEKINSSLATDVEKLFAPASGYDSVASSLFTGSETIKNKYLLSTPSKLLMSVSYVFQEVEDVVMQKGFITADVEYTNYKWMKFEPFDNSTDANWYLPQNQIINSIYKEAINIRIGGEIKFKTLMARAGVGYYGSPYKDSKLNANKTTISGGLGYRDKGFFVDVSYVHRLNKDVNFPYRINPPKANTFASLKENGGYFLLTFGIKR